MNFRHRSKGPELLDNPGIPLEDIRRNMRELDVINTWLGGHGITIEGVKKFIRPGLTRQEKVWHICEIGCGGADNLRAISEWGEKNGLRITFTGIDINPHCIGMARETKLRHPADFILSDYKTVRFERKPDIIFSSLFCHHFSDAELKVGLRWMHQNSGEGFFINDLHRHPLAYWSIKLLTRLLSNSYLVKNDAPLSVARGFRKDEVLVLLKSAGLDNFTVDWKWAFRWLVAVKH